MYIVYRHFDRSCIYKPHTSRPANSERFLVAEGFRSINPAVVEHLFAANDVINSFKSVAGNAINQQMVKRTGDVIRLLRRGTVDADEPFAEFLLHSNKCVSFCISLACSRQPGTPWMSLPFALRIAGGS